MSDIRALDTKEQAKKDYLKGMKYKNLIDEKIPTKLKKACKHRVAIF